jgi:thiamine biosynthesis protein ThiS
MKLWINGEDRNIDQSLSVEDLLKNLGIDPRKVAVERNLEIVSKSTYAQIMVAEGDRLEIVHFIGGGVL